MERVKATFAKQRIACRSHRQSLGIALGGLMGIWLTVFAAEAATEQAIDRTFTFARADWSESVDLPLFDRSLGELQSITFHLSSTVGGNLRFESLDAAPQTITMRLQALLRVGAPAGLTGVTDLITLAPMVEITDDATAADGLIDFAGASGGSFLSLSQYEQDSITYDAGNPLWEFSIREFFTTDSPGSTIALPVSALSQSSGSGADTLATILQTSSGGDLSIEYVYVPVPEPHTLSLLGVAWVILSPRRRRR